MNTHLSSLIRNGISSSILNPDMVRLGFIRSNTNYRMGVVVVMSSSVVMMSSAKTLTFSMKMNSLVEGL